MPERRPRRDPGAAGGLADADRIGATLPDQLQRGIDQHPPEIAMVIRLWRGRPADPTARFAAELAAGFGGGRIAPPNITRL